MFLKYVKDSGHHLLMTFNCVRIYEDIIHVDCHIALIDEVFEDVIPHCLEGGQTIGKAKEHDKGLKEAPICWKVAFYLSPSLICMLYPQCTSNFMKYFALESKL